MRKCKWEGSYSGRRSDSELGMHAYCWRGCQHNTWCHTWYPKPTAVKNNWGWASLSAPYQSHAPLISWLHPSLCSMPLLQAIVVGHSNMDLSSQGTTMAWYFIPWHFLYPVYMRSWYTPGMHMGHIVQSMKPITVLQGAPNPWSASAYSRSLWGCTSPPASQSRRLP